MRLEDNVLDGRGCGVDLNLHGVNVSTSEGPIEYEDHMTDTGIFQVMEGKGMMVCFEPMERDIGQIG